MGCIADALQRLPSNVHILIRNWLFLLNSCRLLGMRYGCTTGMSYTVDGRTETERALKACGAAQHAYWYSGFDT